jgi:RsiW-degrading membrane proteinase PrsW (M82 family)
MGPARRRHVVVVLLVAYVVLLLFGRRVLGEDAGVAVLVGSFVLGFAWLTLLVAPWAARGRPRPRSAVRGSRPRR